MTRYCIAHRGERLLQTAVLVGISLCEFWHSGLSKLGLYSTYFYAREAREKKIKVTFMFFYVFLCFTAVSVLIPQTTLDGNVHIVLVAS